MSDREIDQKINALAQQLAELRARVDEMDKQAGKPATAGRSHTAAHSTLGGTDKNKP